MKFGSNLSRFHKAYGSLSVYEVTTNVGSSEVLFCTNADEDFCLGKSDKLYIHTVATLPCTNARGVQGESYSLRRTQCEALCHQSKAGTLIL